MRIQTLLTGFLITAAALFSLAHPGGTFAILAFPVGMAMLLAGINRILLSLTPRSLELSRWLLLEGLITVILALIILGDQIGVESAAWATIGTWTLFTGLSRLFSTFMLKHRGMHYWIWDLFLNLMTLSCGILSLLQQTVGAMDLSALIGILFLLHGISFAVLGFTLPKSMKLWHHKFRNQPTHREPGETRRETRARHREAGASNE